jgi:hypothetical protein
LDIQAAAKLREVGEEDAAASLEAGQEAAPHTFKRPSWWPFQDRPGQHTAHAFGYLAPASASSAPLPIQHAGNIVADPALKNGSIKITLDRLRVAAYPGGGMHRVLLDFYAQNQVPGQVEHLHFNATYRVREGEQAAILGYPIFVGLNVGSVGVAFRCSDSRDPANGVGLGRVGVQPGQRPSGEQGRAGPLDPVQLPRLQRQPPGRAVSLHELMAEHVKSQRVMENREVLASGNECSTGNTQGGRGRFSFVMLHEERLGCPCKTLLFPWDAPRTNILAGLFVII